MKKFLLGLATVALLAPFLLNTSEPFVCDLDLKQKELQEVLMPAYKEKSISKQQINNMFNYLSDIHIYHEQYISYGDNELTDISHRRICATYDSVVLSVKAIRLQHLLENSF